MLIVRVELHSAITGEVTEIARTIISNNGTGTRTYGNYYACSYKGRDKEALNRHVVDRAGFVYGHAREQEHVLSLACKALKAMGYGK